MLRYFTAGESHGECLSAIIEGLVAGLKIDEDFINEQLYRRQQGYGRGARMKLETDRVHFTGGLRSFETIGAPLALQIKNKDNSIDKMPSIANPRPGHADLAGIQKYARSDVRDILERSSARETAIRVAVGSIARLFLKEFGIQIVSHVVQIGPVGLTKEVSFEDITLCENSPLRCAHPETEKKMMLAIDESKSKGSSAGGVFEVMAQGVPVGLGSHAQWDRKLDARLAYGLMSLQAIKGVSFGAGFSAASTYGHELHDEISYEKDKGYTRLSNRAGGIEGGMSNGQNILVRAAMKPLSTLIRALKTVDINSKEESKASVQRTDTCAVPAAGVVGEAIVAWELAVAFLEKFGGDSLGETKRNYDSFLSSLG
ncbi:chorismate synthase [PVC group bacterium (ex Bugula neritina AB1)]|nr:chorismate synthase [PVC group bacterium (ex Bugula neritina AB1)]